MARREKTTPHAASPNPFAATLRTAMRQEHPGIFVKVQSLNEEMGEMSAGPRFNTVLISGFASIALVVAGLALAAAAASFGPARRAAVVDPMEALRSD